MNRFLTIAVATATLAGVSAPAMAQDAEVSMLTGKVYRALRDCNLDANMIDQLTMSQIAGITLTASSSDEAEKCQRIEAIAINAE